MTATIPAPSCTRLPSRLSPAFRSESNAGPADSRGARLTQAAVRYRRVIAVLMACLLVASALAHAAPAARADGARWVWPIAPPHEVVRTFETPAHRYAPGHRGIDIATAKDDSVFAVEDGVVHFAGPVAGRRVLSIRHHDGLLSTYEPVLASVKAGDTVAAGQFVGTVHEPVPGSDHDGSVPVLHLGARVDKDYLDPLPLLGAATPSVLLPWSELVAWATA